MFIGEMGCWLVVGIFWIYHRYSPSAPQSEGYTAVVGDDAEEAGERASISSRDSRNPLQHALLKSDETRLPLNGGKVILLSIPAICDILGTTLMNVGLLFVVASIYQMTRGALVLFVGLFSVIFLRRRLELFQWLALVLVVIGVGIVGLAGALYKEDKISIPSDAMLVVRESVVSIARTARTPETIRTIVGILLIAGAQIFTATQFVVEEFILEKYALEPIKVVGWEGIFGFLVTGFGMIVLHLAIGRTDAGRGGYFDMVEGLQQVFSNPRIGWSSLAIMLSIGCVHLCFFSMGSPLTASRGFNFFGLSVTRTVSATSRSTIDTCRTLFIWLVSLGLGWETFKWLQVAGFVLLVYGTFLFNGLVQPPLKRCMVRKPAVLLPEEPIEHI